MMAQIRLLLLCIIGLFFSQGAQSAYSNYNSVLLGEKAAGMGGAFTAISGDATASPFYNPATTVLMEGSSLSATVNVYNKYDTSFGEARDFTAGAERINRGFFRSLPASSSTIFDFESFAVGVSILVPDYDFFSGSIKNTNDVSSNISSIDESLWAGGTFSAKLTAQDSVGLSVYYTARNLSRSVSDRIETGAGTGATITSEEKNLTANSVVGIFGYHRKMGRNWLFGISYRPPSLPIAGEASFYRSTTVTNPYSSTVVEANQTRVLTKVPAKLAIGFARENPGYNTVSFDLQLYSGQSYMDLPEMQQGSDDLTFREVMNFSIGYEQILKEWLSLRLGYFTNRSAHPMPSPAPTLRQGDHIDMHGFSANLKIDTAQKTFFTFGGYYTGGRGYSTHLIGGNLARVRKSQQVFTMLVSSGFTF